MPPFSFHTFSPLLAEQLELLNLPFNNTHHFDQARHRDIMDDVGGEVKLKQMRCSIKDIDTLNHEKVADTGLELSAQL